MSKVVDGKEEEESRVACDAEKTGESPTHW